MISTKFNEAAFLVEMKRIMELTGQTIYEQGREQMRNFVSDAMALTPPFGKKPLVESSKSQHTIGIKAVRRDITQRGFRPLTDLRLYSGLARGKTKSGRAKKEYSDLGKQVRKAVKKKDWHLAEELLRQGKIRTTGVIQEPTKQLKNQLRDKAGRIQRRRSYLTATSGAKNKAFSKLHEAKSGLAKSGWAKAMRVLLVGTGDKNKARMRFLPWISGKSGMGNYVETRGNGNFSSTVTNGVSYIQHAEPRITAEAWNSRVRMIEKQRRAIESAIRKKAANDDKLKGSVV